VDREEIVDIRYTATVIVIWAAVIAGAPSTAAHTQAPAQDSGTDLASICVAGEEAVQLGNRPQLLAAVPPEITVTALANHPAQELPEGTEFVLSLDRLTLAPGTEMKSRRIAGPTLFLVEEGTVAVIDNGHAQPAGRPGFVPGESVLVERNRLVKLHNNGNEPGSVLLLGLLPPEGQFPIGAFGAPPLIWVPFLEEREQLTHRRMLSGEIGGLAREETLLFAACLHWTAPASEMTPMNYPGPVGLLVLRGQVVINETERIGAGSCWLSPSDTPLRIRAGEPAPDILLFGALRTSAQPQMGTEGSEASSSLDCAGPSAAADD
jgi:hypothetical protein